MSCTAVRVSEKAALGYCTAMYKVCVPAIRQRESHRNRLPPQLWNRHVELIEAT